MTTAALKPLVDLDLLCFIGVAAPVETAALPLELAPKKSPYGYDDDQNDGYDDDEEDEDDEDDDDEDDEDSYDDEDEEEDLDEDDDDEDDEDEDDEDDEDEDDDDDEDDDIGYYTLPLNSSAFLM